MDEFNFKAEKRLSQIAILCGAALDVFAVFWTFMPGREMDPVILTFRGYSKVLLIAALAGYCYVFACFYGFWPVRRQNFFTMKKMNRLGGGLFLAGQSTAVLVQYIHMMRNYDSYTMYMAVRGVIDANGVFMKALAPVMALFLALLVLTTFIMLIKDGPKKAIITTLLIGIALGAAQVLGLFMSRFGSRFGIFINVPGWFADLFNALFVYTLCMILAAWICSLTAKSIEPEYSGEYVIILGCGLKRDGTVGTNLTGRIKAALAYRDQRKEEGLDTVLVASGGQGKDEAFSEAESIRRYLEQQGEDVSGMLLETSSANTRENLRFSKKLIRKKAKGEKVKTAYATSGFHLFRTGIIADKAGMDAEGIGCPCPWYDRISLYFRECAALVWQGRTVHLCSAGAMVLFGFLIRMLYRMHTGL